jgi:hypothetical protein
LTKLEFTYQGTLSLIINIDFINLVGGGTAAANGWRNVALPCFSLLCVAPVCRLFSSAVASTVPMRYYAIFKLGLHQGFVGGEIGPIGQFATAKLLNCRCRLRVIRAV